MKTAACLIPLLARGYFPVQDLLSWNQWVPVLGLQQGLGSIGFDVTAAPLMTYFHDTAQAGPSVIMLCIEAVGHSGGPATSLQHGNRKALAEDRPLDLLLPWPRQRDDSLEHPS